MRDKNILYTLNILQRFYRDIRPFLPVSMREDIDRQLQELDKDDKITLKVLEHKMSEIGKLLYPYRKASREFYDAYRYELGEQLFESHVPKHLQKHYKLFLVHGGTHEDIFTGHAVHFFTPEERTDFIQVAIDVDHALKAHTIQAVQSTHKKSFDVRVAALQRDVEVMQHEIQELYNLADNTNEPYQAHIRATAEGIEHGFAFLGPSPHVGYVAQLVEEYRERSKEI